MHIELTLGTIKIFPDTVQDQVFIEKILNRKEIVIFERKLDADSFHLESLTE
jgi:hypothetical protein